MTLAEAQSIIAAPVFGDNRCLEARDTIEGLTRAKEIEARLRSKFCDGCDGEGVHVCPDCSHEHDCFECGGIGLKTPALTTDCDELEEMWALRAKYGH